jgi:hypothetical protein
MGKGHEFSTTIYKTSWDVAFQIEKYTSAEFLAWVMAYSLGKSVKAGGAPNFTYTCTPLDPVTDGEELPYFTFVEQVRPGAGVILDRAAVGCAVEGWTLSIASGPGRANCKLVADCAGSGRITQPSAIVIPAATAEKLLPAAGLTLTINGVDYVTNRNFVSLQATWKNNLKLDDGFYPGSGFQTPGDASSGAVRGRMEIGNRELGLAFVARFVNGSDEHTKLLAQTEGTAVIGLTYDVNNAATLTYQRVQFSAVEIGETDDVVTVAVTCEPLWHNVNKLFTASCKCNIDEIAEAA